MGFVFLCKKLLGFCSVLFWLLLGACMHMCACVCFNGLLYMLLIFLVYLCTKYSNASIHMHIWTGLPVCVVSVYIFCHVVIKHTT